MFINITKSETGGNTGSCAQLVNYLEKENKLVGFSKELWFNESSNIIAPFKVRSSIDANVAKLSKIDGKFYLVNLSPSQKELSYLKERFGEEKVAEKLKEYAIKMMDEYAKNFKRKGVTSNRDLLWFGEVEKFRYYSYKDKQVKDGSKKAGDRKEGLQYHIQIIVSRKDITNSIKLSPQNTSRGKNQVHSQKMGQFDRFAFKQSGEDVFDESFGFERSYQNSLAYSNAVKKGDRSTNIKYAGVGKLVSQFAVLASNAGEIIQEIDRHAFRHRSSADSIRSVVKILNNLHWFLKRRRLLRHQRLPSFLRGLIWGHRVATRLTRKRRRY